MANLIIAGAAGRMGRMLVALGAASGAHRIVGAVEASDNTTLGRDVGDVAGIDKLGVTITSDYAAIAKPGSVTLDFTNAAAAMEHLEAAVRAIASIVIGSTGF